MTNLRLYYRWSIHLTALKRVWRWLKFYSCRTIRCFYLFLYNMLVFTFTYLLSNTSFENDYSKHPLSMMLETGVLLLSKLDSKSFWILFTLYIFIFTLLYIYFTFMEIPMFLFTISQYKTKHYTIWGLD